MLTSIAKKSWAAQNFIVKTFSKIHPSIEHNLEKIHMLKKAFFQCELEDIGGDYFEFGVYEGTSLYGAASLAKKLKGNRVINLFGFDSFDVGFKYFDEKDKHPFFKEGDFVSSYTKVAKRLSKFNRVKLIPGYFEESIQGRSPQEMLGSNKCAIVFIDCDLMNPALIALEFVRPILQKGTIIILDDYWAYRGDPELGTAGALKRFVTLHPEIKIRDFNTYGHGGMSFIVYDCQQFDS
ncbi:MAG: class I SAM-dependent methyltransferase [Proteobacteria bacterium]|nr:class I SAM-dependent methyltransferase [Pseudomonadota bacterium]